MRLAGSSRLVGQLDCILAAAEGRHFLGAGDAALGLLPRLQRGQLLLLPLELGDLFACLGRILLLLLANRLLGGSFLGLPRGERIQSLL